MPSQYQPKDHIQHLEIAPRSESVLDQREITVQTYQTTVPFDYDVLNAGLGSAWLTPAIRLGVFARSPGVAKDEIHVVLGLQGELSVRAYDFDARRPLWFSWQDLVVDTVSVRYVRDESGFIRFTTAGGGLRITDEKLEDFNAAFLKIPKAATQKLQFDLSKLRDLCFNRFADRLYMLRFSNPAATEYRSIDHALFQSRRYIDPAAERLREVRSDAQVKIESFDSDANVCTDDLTAPVEVRFAIRGLSGALRLRFPKISYKTQIKTGEEQTRVFYRLVDDTVKSIFDADYYARRTLSLAELEQNPEFPEFADTTPYREVLSGPEARKGFFSGLDLGAPKNKWLPHVRAIDEMISSDVVGSHVAGLTAELVQRDPSQAVRLLLECRTDTGLSHLGKLTANSICSELQKIPSEIRALAEETLLAWMIDHEEESWDVEPGSGIISVKALRWRKEDLSVDVLPSVLWKLTGILHARLTTSNGDAHPNLCKYDWCMAAAKVLPPNHSRSPAALRLVTDGRVPQSVKDADQVLKNSVSDLRELDDAVLTQFGLPLWPRFAASRTNGNIVISNNGIGSAIAVATHTTTTLFGDTHTSTPLDLQAGQSILLPDSEKQTTIDIVFEKFGQQRSVILPIIDAPPENTGQANAPVDPRASKPKFDTPPNSGWKDVRIKFLDGHTVSITVGSIQGRLLFSEMGMSNAKNKKPTKQWELLRAFAKSNGAMTWNHSDANRKNQKRQENLSKDLQRFFGISTKPIMTDGTGWTCLFTVDGDA